MSAELIFTMVKQIACALFSLILPFLGIGRCETGLKAPESSDTVRVMSFNVRCGEFDREEIVPQLIADYLPDSNLPLQPKNICTVVLPLSGAMQGVRRHVPRRLSCYGGLYR